MPRLSDEPQEPSNWKRKAFVILILIITATILLYPILRKHSDDSTSTAKVPTMDVNADESDTSPVPSPRKRSAFGPSATTVRGFPTKGGLYFLNVAGPVELDFLGLDRFHEASPSDDPVEEEAFCQRMRALGARWFQNETDVDKEVPSKVRDGKRVGRMELWFGWPEDGGVWLLEVEEFEGARRGVGGRIRNAKNMEERCRFIDRLGGTFFGDRNKCTLTRDITF
ncbi:MAG: hypothetical protein L6R40_001583 [Gallowayella cf. fulva]|nr:MAG: hypothetical protein L6R40_001583 [Xanthomendoza cf. fulva]